VNDKIQHIHLEREAAVYLRQSTLKQVYEHRESTARQYALGERAIELGWPIDRVKVIDDDLGESGAAVDRREGFKQLAKDVSEGRVGAIFAIEVSRLARSCADWHHLLDLCGIADVVIADEQACYTPRDYNDRLLLGLKGQMSEAELHWMRLRLQGGKLNKARRGELYRRPTPGYVWDRATNRLRLDPDEQVQRAVRLIFERLRIDGSMMSVVRYFVRRGLDMPAYDPQTGETRMMAASKNQALSVLKNPTYAGAYVYGRSERRTRLVEGKIEKRAVILADPCAWKICLRDHHPAYIEWEEYMANQRKLAENRTNHGTIDQRGAAREGSALLQGLALCGRCGRRMQVHYQGRHGQAQYVCPIPVDPRTGHTTNCFNVASTLIDEAVVKLFLDAVQPAEVEVGLQVMREVERQSAEVERQWTLRLDRSRYEARLAERRYKAVDPDNRVIARTLEKEWNDKLGEVERLEREHGEAQRRDRLVISESDRARIMELAKDLPRVWNGGTTTHAERKNLLRMLIREVSLSPVDVPTKLTKVRVLWQTGVVSELTVERLGRSGWDRSSVEVEQAIAELFAAGLSDEDIAAEVKRRGLLHPRRWHWGAYSVRSLRWRQGLRRVARKPSPEQRPDGLLSLRGVATKLGVSLRAVRYWIEEGLLTPAENGRGNASWFVLDAPTVERLKPAVAKATSRLSRLTSTHPKEAL
jgi:DNA invertase Pin-like site-specific DNA recombinase